MNNYKINCVGMRDEQKRLVQDAFFKLGYVWTIGGATFLEDEGDQHYYLAYPSGKLTYCEDIDTFTGKNHTEIILNELLKLANMEEYMETVKFTQHQAILELKAKQQELIEAVKAIAEDIKKLKGN